MTSKVVVITGANSGIGFALARKFAETGARVCMACRNPQKAEAAARAIREENSEAQLALYSLDLASLDSVRDCADAIAADHSRVDVLVNNAGVFVQHFAQTREGFEWQFGVNYLGPFVFTHRLLPMLDASEDARIIHLSSMMHLLGRIQPKTFHERKPYIGLAAYAQSKLANLMFSDVLAQRLQARGITSNAIHPGGVDSGIYDDLPAAVRKPLKKMLISPEKSVQLIQALALSPEHRQTTGQYFSVQTPKRRSRYSRDRNRQLALYSLSCRLVNEEPLGEADLSPVMR